MVTGPVSKVFGWLRSRLEESPPRVPLEESPPKILLLKGSNRSNLERSKTPDSPLRGSAGESTALPPATIRSQPLQRLETPASMYSLSEVSPAVRSRGLQRFESSNSLYSPTSTSSFYEDAEPLTQFACQPELRWYVRNGKKPRSYQLEAYDQIKVENLVVQMCTGGGKTQIALMALDHFLEQEPDKLAVFCVSTSVLAKQQARYIEVCSRHRDVIVYEGRLNVDWQEVHAKMASGLKVVVVLTRDLLQVAVDEEEALAPSSVSIMVLDEVQSLAGSGRLSAVLANWPASTRLVGLTAGVAAPAQRLLRAGLFAHAGEQILVPRGCAPDVMSAETKQAVIDASRQLFTPLLNLLPGPGDVDELLAICTTNCERLGRSAWFDFVEEGLAEHMHERLETRGQQDEIRLAAALQPELQPRLAAALLAVRVAKRERWEAYDELLKDVPAISNRCVALLRLLIAMKSENEAYKCVVLVKDPQLAVPLAHLINKNSDLQADCDENPGDVARAAVDQSSRAECLEKLRSGEARVLVSDLLENGLDMGDCNTVVCFDDYESVKSQISPTGSRVFFFENAPRPSDESSKMTLSALGAVRVADGEAAFYGVRHPTSGAELTLMTVHAKFEEFVCRLTGGEVEVTRLFERTKESRRIVRMWCPCGGPGGRPMVVTQIDVDKALPLRQLPSAVRRLHWASVKIDAMRFMVTMMHKLQQAGVVDHLWNYAGSGYRFPPRPEWLYVCKTNADLTVEEIATDPVSTEALNEDSEDPHGPTNFKGELNEYTSRALRTAAAPEYSVQAVGGQFVASVTISKLGIDGLTGESRPRKKEAEQSAAEMALKDLRARFPEGPLFVETEEEEAQVPKSALIEVLRKRYKWTINPTYSCESATEGSLHGFKATVGIPELDLTVVGETRAKKRDAEATAASRAIAMLKQRIRTRAASNASDVERDSLPTHNYKGELNEALQRRLKRSSEVHYRSCEEGLYFRSVVWVIDLQLEVAGSPRARKRDAEQSAANKALIRMAEETPSD